MGYDKTKINDVLYCKECGEVGGFEEIHQFKAASWASELVCNLLYHMELGYARNDGTNQHTILAFIWGHSPPFEKQDILNTQIKHSTMNG